MHIGADPGRTFIAAATLGLSKKILAERSRIAYQTGTDIIFIVVVILSLVAITDQFGH
jgi:hypothetical protein